MKYQQISIKTKELAQILYKQAINSNSLAELENDIEKIVSTSAILDKYGFNNKQSPNEQTEILQNIFAELELGLVCKSFIYTLIKGREIELIFEVANNFKIATSELKGIKFVEVISTVKLTDSQIEKIKQHISKESGNDVYVNNTIDSSIIGGLKIKIGNYLIDDSVEGYINQFMNTTKGA